MPSSIDACTCGAGRFAAPEVHEAGCPEHLRARKPGEVQASLEPERQSLVCEDTWGKEETPCKYGPHGRCPICGLVLCRNHLIQHTGPGYVHVATEKVDPEGKEGHPGMRFRLTMNDPFDGSGRLSAELAPDLSHVAVVPDTRQPPKVGVFRVEPSPAVPPDEVRAVDAHGDVVGRITNVGAPIEALPCDACGEPIELSFRVVTVRGKFCPPCAFKTGQRPAPPVPPGIEGHYVPAVGRAVIPARGGEPIAVSAEQTRQGIRVAVEVLRRAEASQEPPRFEADRAEGLKRDEAPDRGRLYIKDDRPPKPGEISVEEYLRDHVREFHPPQDPKVDPTAGYLDGLGTIRSCIDCACLTAGGPTRCLRCVRELQAKKRQGAEVKEIWADEEKKSPVAKRVQAYKAGKVPFQLIPPVAERYHAQAMGVGAQKYGPWNWHGPGVVRASDMVGAIRRHLNDYERGGWLNREVLPDGTVSELPHLAHLMASASILLEAHELGVLDDDRPALHRGEDDGEDEQTEDYLAFRAIKGECLPGRHVFPDATAKRCRCGRTEWVGGLASWGVPISGPPIRSCTTSPHLAGGDWFVTCPACKKTFPETTFPCRTTCGCGVTFMSSIAVASGGGYSVTNTEQLADKSVPTTKEG